MLKRSYEMYISISHVTYVLLVNYQHVSTQTPYNNILGGGEAQRNHGECCKLTLETKHGCLPMVPNAFRNLVKHSYILVSINIVPILLCVKDGHQSSIALISCKFVWMLK